MYNMIYYMNSNNFYNNFSDRKYDLDLKNKSENKDKRQIISTEALTNFYKEIIKEFPIVSIIEDPFDKDHWEAWTNFTASTDIQVCLLLITFF
jgi:enolase